MKDKIIKLQNTIEKMAFDIKDYMVTAGVFCFLMLIKLLVI